MSIAEQQNALVKTTRGTAMAPYSAVEAPVAAFFGMPVEQRRLDTPAPTYNTIHVEEPPPAGNQSFVSSLRKKVTGLFSKSNGASPVQIAEKPNLNFYKNNTPVNNSGSKKTIMTVNNVRANLARRSAAVAATRRRPRKSKPNTRRRR
jgi:hypothetical protein